MEGLQEREEAATDVENQVETPLVDALAATGADGRVPFHMPGHKRGHGVPRAFELLNNGGSLLKFDLTELPGLDNLQVATGVLQRAQELAAEAWGAHRSFFLVNGTTVGIQAALWSLVAESDNSSTTLVLLQRNAHKSALAGAAIAGAQVAFLAPEYSHEIGSATSVTPERVAEALERWPEASVLLLTRPTYEGHCADVRAISALCRERNVTLVVDEAHGAHLAFTGGQKGGLAPASALHEGADIVVQSVHKTLGAMTQASLLHVSKNCPQATKIAKRLQSCLNMLQSTSPSYLLMASLDAARAAVQMDGGLALRRCAEKAAALASRIQGEIQGLSVFGLGCYGDIQSSSLATGTQDPTRLTVIVSGIGLSGFAAKKLLYEEYMIAAELASPHAVSFILSEGNTEDDLDALFQALSRLALEHRDRVGSASFDSVTSLPRWPDSTVSPRQAFHAPSVLVRLEDAEGRLGAEMVCPYPPGIPVILPGERISRDAVEYILAVADAQCRVAGLGGDGCISVLVEAEQGDRQLDQ